MDTIFFSVLSHSFKAAVAVSAILLIRYLLGTRLSPTLRHGLWGLLAVPLLLPEFTIPVPVSTMIPVEIPVIPVMEVPQTVSAESAAEIVPTVRTTFITLETLLAATWLSGAALLVFVAAFHFFRERKRFRCRSEIVDDDVLQILNSCRKMLHVRQSVEVFQSPRIVSPVLMGIFRPKILLPAKMLGSVSERELVHFFLHELSHWKRCDILTHLLMSLVCTVHWFNPLLWLALRWMKHDAEEATDQLALSHMTSPQRIQYAQTLLAIAERFCNASMPKMHGAVGIIESAFLLTRRIEMIRTQRTYKMYWTLVAVLLGTVCSVAVLLNVQFVAAAPANETDKPVTQITAEQAMKTEAKPARESFGDLTWLNVSGKVVAPAGVATGKFQIQEIGHSVKFFNRSGKSSNGVNADGTFVAEVWADYNYAFFFNDPDLQWAAKPVFLAVGNESPKEEVVIKVEKGNLIEATLLNQETGEPISDMTVWLAQEVEFGQSTAKLKTYTNIEMLQTDGKGQIKRCVTPGKFQLTVDVPVTDDEKYSIAFEVKQGTDAKPVLKIPPPFVGRAVDEAGKPFVHARVNIYPNRGRDILFSYTDKDGIFKHRTAPKDTLVEITYHNGRNPTAGFVTWLKDELTDKSKNNEIWEIRLQKCATASGRLLDAKTGEPVPKTLVFYQYENPSNSAQKSFFPKSVRTDDAGNFKVIDLIPGLTYRFFTVPGRTKEYAGGQYEPRVELKTVKIENPEQTLDLGDLKF